MRLKDISHLAVGSLNMARAVAALQPMARLKRQA